MGRPRAGLGTDLGLLPASHAYLTIGGRTCWAPWWGMLREADGTSSAAMVRPFDGTMMQAGPGVDLGPSATVPCSL